MSDPHEPDGDWEVELARDDLDLWDEHFGDDPHSLVELVNRLLDKGVVITGDVTISVAGVDLVYLGLSAVLTSIATARDQLGRRVGGSVGKRRDQGR
jgi:gas vesicle structural protein